MIRNGQPWFYMVHFIQGVNLLYELTDVTKCLQVPTATANSITQVPNGTLMHLLVYKAGVVII